MKATTMKKMTEKESRYKKNNDAARIPCDSLAVLPLVSICVPAYNHAQYLPALLDSVLTNGYGNIELLIINDGSKDNTDDIINNYTDRLKKNLKSFRYITRKNKGLPYTLNELISITSGKYIKIIASDDILNKDSIIPFVEHIEFVDCDIVFGDLILIDEYGTELNKIKGIHGLNEEFSIEDFDICQSLKRSPTIGSAWLMKLSKIKEVGGFDINSKIEDWEFINNLLISGIKFSYIDIAASFYRTFENKGPYFGSYYEWLNCDLYILNKYKHYCKKSYMIGVGNVFKMNINRSFSSKRMRETLKILIELNNYHFVLFNINSPLFLPRLIFPKIIKKFIKNFL